MRLDKEQSTAMHHGLFSKTVGLVLVSAALIWSGQTARAQTASGSTDLVISQVYTSGGEPGAALRNDFIEFFNRGTNNVNLADYSLVISTTGPGATPDVTISFVLSSGIIVVPGQYILFQLGSSGNNGSFSIVAAEFNDPTINLGSTSGKIALVQSKSSTPLGCPVGQDPALDDYVAYGPASCAEGAAPATAPATANVALLRRFGGCGDTDNNAADFITGGPSPRNEFSVTQACTPASSANTIQFEVNHVDAGEGQASVEIFVTRSGGTSTAATVQYGTVSNQPTRQSGKATDRSDYTTALGTLRFAPGEIRKSFRIIITDDAFSDGLQNLTVRLGSPTGPVALGALSTMAVGILDNDTLAAGPNPIDSTNFFVRQQYADFLGRDPDISGLNFWINEIDSCGTDTQCRAVKQINVSAAFYLSIEFQ
ncbi:MAG: lamin tail domain-containing protein, partial [Acidobacteriota bacterium]|nr:lamin tail domain-containing protein [Acidobacteriota bacterium]